MDEGGSRRRGGSKPPRRHRSAVSHDTLRHSRRRHATACGIALPCPPSRVARTNRKSNPATFAGPQKGPQAGFLALGQNPGLPSRRGIKTGSGVKPGACGTGRPTDRPRSAQVHYSGASAADFHRLPIAGAFSTSRRALDMPPEGDAESSIGEISCNSATQSRRITEDQQVKQVIQRFRVQYAISFRSSGSSILTLASAAAIFFPAPPLP